MAAADLLIRGTVLTVDDAQPTAEALAVSDGRIVAVRHPCRGKELDRPGDRNDRSRRRLCHAHPRLAGRPGAGRPAGDRAQLRAQGLLQQRRGPCGRAHPRHSPDPKGARYGHDADGELDGTAEEIAAVFSLLGGVIDPADYPAMLHSELRRLNRAGLTTCSDMAFDPVFWPVLEQLRKDLTVRLRVYEVSTARMHTDMAPANGDDLLRQVGIKIWVDGSPWVGNVDLSFPYLDTDATRTIGVAPGSCGHANYTREQLTEIVHAYFSKGW